MNVLLVRTSAMGDIVHCLPVLSALRRGLPQARIGWVVEEAFAPLLNGHPEIDELIVVRMRPWRKDLLSGAVRRQMRAARAALRGFGADVAFDLMGNHKGGFLAWLTGARRVIGPARAFRREKSSAMWINEPTETRGVHAVDKALGLLAALGIDDPPVDFGGSKILSQTPPEAEAFLSQRATPWVVIQPGTGWGNKTWPAAWWGRVASDLRRRAAVEVWVPIAPGEERLAREVVAASDGAAQAIDAAAFPFLVALLRHSRLVLGGDTGPVHLAHALGTPVLCLIGPTDPERNGPYGTGRGDATAQVLWRRLPCSGCYRRFAEPKACLLGISPAAVAAKAQELLRDAKVSQRRVG